VLCEKDALCKTPGAWPGGEGLNQIGGVCAFADVVEVVRRGNTAASERVAIAKNWTPPSDALIPLPKLFSCAQMSITALT
jgi:hypothetical protein